MMGRKFLGIQTVISGKTRFFRTVYGAILGFMQLERLSVDVLAHQEGTADVYTQHAVPALQRIFLNQAPQYWALGANDITNQP